MAAKTKPEPCRWTNEADAFSAFATHAGKTESARHIKPLHWYVACRLVVEGGFHPDSITPHPPFRFETKTSKGKKRHLLIYDEKEGGSGEQVILGGLKTKNVDVVVNLHHLGPVMAVSCKGVTKSFRNLTNRMEETIGECTNLHITYPAMVIGYFALLRANRTEDDAADAPEIAEEDAIATETDDEEVAAEAAEAALAEDDEERATASGGTMAANDIAIAANGETVEGIVRFHAALREMTGRRGIRDEISRYEAMTMALVEPKGPKPGSRFPDFPAEGSPLHVAGFFATLYQRYEERFVYGAPLLADRGISTRYAWDPESPALASLTDIGYEPRLTA